MSIGIAIIGAGAIALANHVPGLALTRARVVALCDSNRLTLDHAAMQTGVKNVYTDYRDAIADDNVDAIIVATTNSTHKEIVLDAARAKKHVLCEKPLALSVADAIEMYRACEAAGVRHMTAFTYRFVPAMRYMKRLIDRGDIGRIYHFRAQRFQDWGDRALGWRQVKKFAGSGEMGDMLSHRIDYAHHLIGPIRSLVADLRTFIPARGGEVSDVDDWVTLIARFDEDATGVLESTKLATGRGEGHRGQDIVEVNGSEGTIVYSTQKPLELSIGRRGDKDLGRVEVPSDFRVWPGSPRDPEAGDPLVTFRYDQSFEFIDAIETGRECSPSLREGAMAQAVMDAAVESWTSRRWADVARIA